MQGLLFGLFLSCIAFVLIPIVPFIVAIARWRAERKRLAWLTRVLLLPMWLLSGFVFGLINPFGILFKSLVDVRDVVRIEWANRWMTGLPKKPSGHPLKVRSDEERERLDAAIAMGVVEDYNDEAREHGQGIDFGDEDE